VSLTLLSRNLCGLCDEAMQALRDLGLDFEVVDIDGRPDLLRLYDQAVPVILDGGRELCRAPISKQTLQAALRAAEVR
jgi:glutaredoxin